MTIVPLTPINRVMVCRNVPFDSTYTDTIWFGSDASQLAYFSGKAKYSWDNLSPSKIQNGFRLPVNADALYDCNYLCFQNSNFGNKWFYCFITDIEYENPNCSRVKVEMDAWQTWMHAISIDECYVIREHANSDNYGEHTLLEPVEVGEYVDDPAKRSGHMEDYDAVIMYATEGQGAGQCGGIFTALTFEHASLSGSAGPLLDRLQEIYNNGRADSVAATFIMPADFYTEEQAVKEINVSVPWSRSKLGEYTPRNKKLLCYPYNMLNVSNSMGQINSYRWEYFGQKGAAAIFTMSCPMGVNPEVVLFPLQYNNHGENFQETMSLSGFPQFAYVIDTYRAWLAQNGNTFAVQTASQLISTGMSIKQGNVSGAVSGVMGIASSVAGVVDKAKQPNHAAGNQTSNAMVALRAKDFYFYTHHIREDYAKVLDDYFDRYGYLTNRLKKPNITGRPSWNYVKTDGAVVTGSVPFGDINIIKNSLDNGITFWHGDYVGDYSRGNGV